MLSQDASKKETGKQPSEADGMQERKVTKRRRRRWWRWRWLSHGRISAGLLRTQYAFLDVFLMALVRTRHCSTILTFLASPLC